LIALLLERSDNTRADRSLAVAVWLLPAAVLLFGRLHIPIAMLVLPAFAGRLIWRLSHGEARCATGAATSGEVARRAGARAATLSGLNAVAAALQPDDALLYEPREIASGPHPS